MNYLAHLYLADLSDTSLPGALMGDFVRGRLDRGRFPEALERGIALHRRIDGFTDSHALVIDSRRRFRPPFRRFAGILVDVFYDHFLACDWPDLHAQSLNVFARRAYALAAAQSNYLPPRLKAALPHFRRNGLLESYRDRAGIERSLRHLSRRFSRANPLARGMVELDTHYGALHADFRAFLPHVEAFVMSEAARLAAQSA